MKLSRVRVVFSLVLFALPLSTALVVGCASQDTVTDSADTGEANVGVATQAASTADVTKVTLTVSGPGIPTAIVKDLKFVNGQWTGKLSGIPVGGDRVFLAEAYDATNTVLYTGEASGVTITKGGTTSVSLVLQQQTPPNPFANGAPQISSLVASAAEAAPGQSIVLGVTATDPDNDPLIYLWTATGGSLANASTASPTWTAPLTDGTQTLSVSVTDGKGGQAGMSVELRTNSKGSAEVSTSFNNWPVVTQVVATPGQLQPGDTSSLTATATDVDGDALAYAWSDSCGGSFSSMLAEAPTWTAPATMPSGGTCNLTVSVSDGRGGAASGELLIGINLPDANLPPVIDLYFQSADAVSATEQVNLWVSASDPEGAAVSFSWSANGGTLGTATDTTSTSELMWTAPSVSGTYTVTATVTDASGFAVTKVFEVAVTGGVASCASDSDCAAGPCNTCPPAVQLCLAPLGPVASLQAGACKSLLSPCTTPTTTTCGPVGTYPVGSNPSGIAFDGTNMWVVHAEGVTKLSPSGVVLGTYAVAGSLSGIAFDGTNMWVANVYAFTVFKLSPSGAVLGTYPVGACPEGIAFDGTNMWVANSNFGSSGSVTQLSPTGVALGTYNAGNNTTGVAFDGTNPWVTNPNDSTVTKLSPSGVALGTYPVGTNPAFGMAFDGTNMWVASYASNNVTKLSPSGATLGTYAVGTGPQYIAFDGTNMWVTNWDSNTVTKLSPTGATLGTYPVGTNPYWIAFDGAHMWVTNHSSGTVTEL